MRFSTLLILILFSHVLLGQIVPDALYNSWPAPPTIITKSLATSRQVSTGIGYPVLPKVTQSDHIGTLPVFKAPEPEIPIPEEAYNPTLTIHQRNQSIIANDLKAHALRRERTAKMMNEIEAALNQPAIQYTLGYHRQPEGDGFRMAYQLLKSMLKGDTPTDFLKAVWAVEHAWDQSLTWEEFSSMFTTSKRHIELLMEQNSLGKKDNLSKIMSIYQYMADTTHIVLPESERMITNKPMLYDYEDYAGRQDPTKIFVSKLLRTGSGQCMSLPMLYFLFSKALGAEAYLAFAPEHSYIKFKDALGNWNNIELTGRMFTTDDFLWQSNFLTGGQVKSGIYLRPLKDKEVLAYLLTTLSITYTRAIGVDDNVKGMANLALEHFPNSLTAHMLLVGYYKTLWKQIQSQYRQSNASQQTFLSDKKAAHIYMQHEGSINHIKNNLGWNKMPDWAYQKWLESVNELANQRQHLVQKRLLEQQLTGN